MRLPFISCLLFASLSFATAALAQEDRRWMCWLGSADDYNIHCLREADPVLDDDPEGTREQLDVARTPSAFPAAATSRSVARGGPGALRRHQDIVWSIPLYSMPFDIKDVELLAQTMMCGTDARCEVVFVRREQQVAGH